MRYELRSKFEDDADDAAFTIFSSENKREVEEALYDAVNHPDNVGMEYWIEEYE